MLIINGIEIGIHTPFKPNNNLTKTEKAVENLKTITTNTKLNNKSYSLDVFFEYDEFYKIELLERLFNKRDLINGIYDSQSYAIYNNMLISSFNEVKTSLSAKKYEIVFDEIAIAGLELLPSVVNLGLQQKAILDNSQVLNIGISMAFWIGGEISEYFQD